ncbi:small ribosomal subunit protein uS10m isoform X2 [Anolis carolinensis]|uniref:Small ribosomal subunit protein uS10m n=1 Tax=Anolis carolinensis TaxID=28377 RepID=G1K988_ANOCA|nr:PREDICTED: 28S ribosomal protein S10, mitochondrial [Anolis carolinensis]|eukprot:XP_003216017.1 PREDICTED: 28S ribosomal protein S10, mitochondrial [Anolis carolinensis]
MAAHRGLSVLRRLWQGQDNFLVKSSMPLKQHNFLQNNHLMWFQFSGAHTEIQQPKENTLVSTSDEPDTLYKRLAVLVKGHDKAVLDSYEYFMVLAAKELGLSIEKVEEPRKKIERFTLLKSVHIYKKHRVQYEMRTHYRYVELKHLTGSTVNVYLEYIQRNLPEGVAMEIKKTRLERLPEHIQTPVWDTLPEVEETAAKS